MHLRVIVWSKSAYKKKLIEIYVPHRARVLFARGGGVGWFNALVNHLYVSNVYIIKYH